MDYVSYYENRIGTIHLVLPDCGPIISEHRIELRSITPPYASLAEPRERRRANATLPRPPADTTMIIEKTF